MGWLVKRIVDLITSEFPREDRLRKDFCLEASHQLNLIAGIYKQRALRSLVKSEGFQPLKNAITTNVDIKHLSVPEAKTVLELQREIDDLQVKIFELEHQISERVNRR